MSAISTSPTVRPSDPWAYCPNCAYCLHGLTSDRCPECGERIDPRTLLVSRIPWAHRRRLGYVRAYLQTVRLVLFNARQIAEDVDLPVRSTDARSFRRVTLLLAFVPMLITLAQLQDRRISFVSLRDVASDLSNALHTPAAWLAPLEASSDLYLPRAIAALLLLIVAMGSARLFYFSRRLDPVRQNRALILGAYGCAAMALIPGVYLIAQSLVLLARSGLSLPPHSMEMALLHSLFIHLAALVPILWWLNGLVLLRRATGCGWGRVTVVAVLWPIVSTLAAVAAAGLFLWASGFGLLVLLSLTG